VLVVGGGSGIGREVALLAAARGAHVVVRRSRRGCAARVVSELKGVTSAEFTAVTAWTFATASHAKALDATVAAFGGLDILINTRAAMFPTSPDGMISDALWATTLDINVTANYLLADEAARAVQRAGPGFGNRADEFLPTPCFKAAGRRRTT